MPASLITAALVLTIDEQDTIHSPGFVLIEEGTITEIGPLGAGTQRVADEQIDLGNRLLMPGLINAHTHSPMSLFRGQAEGHSLFTLEGWYNTIRIVEDVMTPDMIGPGVAVSCAEMIRTGTTCFADQYFWMDQIVPEVRQSGLRAALAYGIVELGNDEARHRELAAAASFIESLADDPLLDGWIGPHAFFVDNTEEAMRHELALARQFGAGLHTHLLTSGEEDIYCRQKYGRSAAAQMEAMGILGQRTLFAHAITLAPEDFHYIARHNSAIAVAVSSAMRNAAGLAPVIEMYEAGITLALGTDNVTNNNSYDMFKEMQILGKVMALTKRQPNALATREIVRMATINGAGALGIEERVGSLEPGKSADIIALDLDEIGWAPDWHEPYTALVYSITGMHVSDVMVAGRWLYRDRAWLTIDYRQAVSALNKAQSELRQRLEQLKD